MLICGFVEEEVGFAVTFLVPEETTIDPKAGRGSSIEGATVDSKVGVMAHDEHCEPGLNPGTPHHRQQA